LVSHSSTARRRRWPWIAAGVGAAAIFGWTAVTAVQVAGAAAQLRDSADAAADHAAALDAEALAADIDVVADHAGTLQRTTDTLPWLLLSRLPVIGSTADSVALVADSAVSAASAAAQVQPLLPELTPEKLLSGSGAMDLDALTRLSDALQRATTHLQSAADSAGAADPGALGPVGAAVSDVQHRLADLPERSRVSAQALEHLNRMMGGDGRRTWTVLLQNGSEARGTGGFLGAYAIVDAQDGRVSVRTMDTNNSLTTPIPNQMMPADFRELWTDEYTSEWNSYNLSRHFPYTAELTRSGFAARGVDVTDVVALDAAVVAAMLAGTGPVSALGATVDAGSAVDFFNRGVYEQFPDPAAKDAVVVALMEQTLDRVFSGEVDLPRMVSAVVPAAQEGRLLLWAADSAEQEQLAEWPAGGEVPDKPGPWLSVAFNNSAANKLDAYIAADIDYDSGACASGKSTATITLTNNAPPTGPDYAYASTEYAPSASGNTRMWVSVYAPVGAEWRSATIDGKREWVSQGRERRHPVWQYSLEIPQGGSTTLEVRFTEPRSDHAPTVSAQPMAIPLATAVTCN
jgi:hypothetical protein